MNVHSSSDHFVLEEFDEKHLRSHWDLRQICIVRISSERQIYCFNFRRWRVKRIKTFALLLISLVSLWFFLCMLKLNSAFNCVKLTIMTIVSPSLCLSLSLFSSGFLLLFCCLSSLPNIPAFFLFPGLKCTVSFSCFSSTYEVFFVLSEWCVSYRMWIHRSCIKPQCEGCTVSVNIHSFHLIKWQLRGVFDSLALNLIWDLLLWLDFSVGVSVNESIHHWRQTDV